MSENCGQFLLDLETRERARTGIANLRVEYNRVHGFYIEVTHGQADKVPDDYRRRQTLKNAERYITPELKAFEDKALSAQERALAREKLAVRRSCCDLAAASSRRCQRVARALAELDAAGGARRARARARLVPRRSSSTEPASRSSEGRHPVVEGAGRAASSPTTARSTPRAQLLLITGPNMGGKSTYMRQVALIALLAHVGSYVPARARRFGPIDRIFTRIGAADDLAGGRSTFMVEMTEAAAILNDATPHSRWC